MRSVSLVMPLLLMASASFAQTNVVTFLNDIGRTGQNLTETRLTPANVNGATFGKQHTLDVDGQVLAQPLYLSSVSIGGVSRSVVYVATAHDSLYAFEAASGAQLWKVSMLDAAHGAAAGAIPDPVSTTGCPDISNLTGAPEHGIIGTPVIDRAANTIYLVSKTFEGTYPVQRLHALDVTTGAERPGSPVVIAATVPGTGAGSSGGQLAFDPKWENQRTALLIANGVVYIAWGSHCDFGPYHGWVMGYRANTLQQVAAYATTPNSIQGGIWLPGGLSADIQGGVPRLFAVMGNGSFDPGVANSNSRSYGSSFIRLNADASGALTVTDSFTPSDHEERRIQDLDTGAGGALIVPDQPGAHPHLIVQLGKSGPLWVIDRDNMGGDSATTNNVLQEIVDGSKLWGNPVYFNGSVYMWPYQDRLRRYPLTNGTIPTTPTQVSTQRQFSWLGTTPAVSANGTQNGILWSIDYSQAPQVVYAHDANDVSRTLWASNQNATRDGAGEQQKFGVPTIADGRVFVPAVNQVMVYGLLANDPDFVLSAAPASLSVTQGNSTSSTLTAAPVNGFTGTVSYAVSGVPAGVTATVSGSTLQVSASAAAVAGSYTLVVTGTSGALAHSVSIPLTVGSVPSFSLGLSSTLLTIAPGATGTIQATVTPSGGFTGQVSFAALGLPAGVTATFAPGASTTGTTVTFNVSPSAPSISGAITIVGTSGTLTRTANLVLNVSQPPDFTLTPDPAAVTVAQGGENSTIILINALNGFTGVIDFSASGVPAGVTANFNRLTTQIFLTFNASATAAVGTSTITVTGTVGALTRTTQVALTVTGGPSFSLSASPSSHAMTPGTTRTSTITVTPQNGFTGTVAYAASGLPTGVTASFAGNVVTFTAASTATAATANVTITGTSGSIVRTTPIALTIGAAPSFTLSASPTSLSLAPGASGQSTVTVTPQNGFTGTVSYAASGLPAGVTATFAGNVVTFTAAAGAPAAGATNVTITGTSGSITRTTSVAIAVSATPSFTLSASPTAHTMTPSSTRTSTMTVTPQNGFTGTVSYAASGLPAGVTASFAGNVVTFTASSSAPAASANVTITGTSGSIVRTTPVAVTVSGTSARFTLSASPSSHVIPRTGRSSSAITVTPIGGFTDTVALSVSNLPSGVTATISGTTVTFIVSSTAPNGTGTATITGTSGSLSATTNVQITVSSSAPDYFLSASPSTLTLPQGGTVSSRVTVNGANGFNGNVGFGFRGLPAGVSASMNPPNSTTAMTITFSAQPNAQTGTFTITVTGDYAGNIHTTRITLTVGGTAQPTVTASPSSVSMSRYGNTSTQLSTAGFGGTVTYSVISSPYWAFTSVSSTGRLTVYSWYGVTGSSTITVRATSGSKSATVNIPVTVNR
jgi:hypothetical protein